MIEFFIAGVPVSQGRPRTFFHKGLGRSCTMNPPESEAWKALVKAKAFPHRPEKPMDLPVRVSLDFILPRPAAAKHPDWACVRPDLDNYIKGTLDALQYARFFRDDSRVVWLEAKKLYSTDGRVGVRVTVAAIEAPVR